MCGHALHRHTPHSNDSLTLTVHRAVTAVSALAVSPSPLQFIGDPILAILAILTILTTHGPLWIRAVRLGKENPSTVVYEVVLCYPHNRACTINRTWEDFQKLKSGLGSWRNAPTFCSPKDIDGLQSFLCEAISKKGREVAMEFFLRRRMDDCGGA
ncbi:hypothetical protein INS49_008145 [Diaporthe citri]|uniref:uncharacterized protein n=1 Tax=Diaporthe citri TaxID=83186 RepID=UPI001C7F3614|nr:uncharacterized protein INS49_008145 [Diaporthe citri]KAG6363050.1 hypothetical protein INS49_008145 [Diaporthe citri]